MPTPHTPEWNLEMDMPQSEVVKYRKQREKDMADKTPFNSPRDPSDPPYHLKNGIGDRAESDRHEADHRKRMGMIDRNNAILTLEHSRARFEAWVKGEPESSPDFTLRRMDGTYPIYVIEAMWRAWQAAQRAP